MPWATSLRRTFATELLGRGIDVEAVRQLGGWSDLTVVMWYVTSSDGRKGRAIEALHLRGRHA
ncbi:MAG TPA: tyrosine-type recombinase/integrase [Myxococcota bacterium]|nr:tyrosine-type recombinase/integrase [Myxococcota bacterium]